MRFSVLQEGRPMTETYPHEQATDAYARMSSKARVRAVLTVS